MLIPGGFASPLRPVLDVTFLAAAGVLDPRITFTRASAATYYDATGLLVSAGSSTPRFNYNSITLTPLGLLLEPAGTNQLQRSEDFGNAYWGKNNVSVTADTTAAPDGNISADKLAESIANDLHNIYRTYAFTSGQTYTLSIFAKADTRSILAIGAGNPTTWAARATFDLSAKTVSIANGTAKIEILPDGWCRCSVTGVAGATASTNIAVFINSFTPYAGDGASGLFVWGAQLEAATFASSYIPTTSASATRAGDVMTIAVSGFPFDATGGALLVSGAKLAEETALTYPRLVDISDGTLNNVVACLWQTSTNLLYMAVNVGGVTQASIGRFGLSQTAVNAIACAWSANDFAASVNGGAVSTDTSGAVPTVDIVRFGVGYAGHLRRVSYWPRRLSNAELQRVSS